MTEAAAKFESWAIVEVMGHSRYAGFVHEQQIGGAALIRVDVPEIDDQPAFTKLLGTGSIFAITPCTEATAKAAAKAFRAVPLPLYELQAVSSVGRLPHYKDRDDDGSDVEDSDWDRLDT